MIELLQSIAWIALLVDITSSYNSCPSNGRLTHEKDKKCLMCVCVCMPQPAQTALSHSEQTVNKKTIYI